ncbi:MAG: ATP-dependent Clp protease ATP-binding subunit [Ruminococcaceae bacterium]|nr:ATP-dependent Clp protease ATP-binding subunit [Oscillospiraceae bacterium]
MDTDDEMDYDDEYDDEDEEDEDLFPGFAAPMQLTDSEADGDEDGEADEASDDNVGEGDSEQSDQPRKRKSHFSLPIEELFGPQFQPGGAVCSDGSAPDGDSGEGEKGSGSSRSKRKRRQKHKYLDTYCSDLTARAKGGKIDRIIGRDREIERIIQILSRRQKNNPCLIGEPGVGKTAIAEGLALRIAQGNVPARLASKAVYLLDLTALVAGTQFRGQFESRIKGLIDEVKSVGNVILFIDEVHNLVGTGDAEGSMNAANILKPALSRGELQVIGATTFTEYRKHIEKDTALERRFQPVKIEEPSIEEAIEVLRGIKDYYEQHHDVSCSDRLLVRAVNLAERYITDRFLPDKAIDLLDEACACAALRNAAREESQRLQAELTRSKGRLAKLMDKNIGADGEPDYERIAQLKSEQLRMEERIAELAPDADITEVTEADLAKVIELWTGIQATRIEQSEYARLSRLADRLRERIKGQDEAIDLVAAAIRRTRVQISPRRRPASFIFVGPTGVGKTELVKVLASELFDTPETLIRLDMSEFMEKHSVSRIIGSPPGYVGYDEAGQLTEKVRRKPYSVLLFDEIEKAHPDVLNILLQILDEGKINDAQGRAVSFENTVIIMTSNAGSNINSTSLGFAKTEGELAKEKALKALGEFLRPEFLARVDEIVCFNPLDDEAFREIARLMCGEYVPALREKGMELTVSDEAVGWLAEHARGGKSAARDLRSLIRREVEDRLAQLLIDNAECPPDSALVVVEEGKLAVKAG